MNHINGKKSNKSNKMYTTHTRTMTAARPSTCQLCILFTNLCAMGSFSFQPVLILTVMRWQQVNGVYQKVNTHVDVDFHLYVPGCRVYHLRGLVEHMGPYGSNGHYISYVRSADDHWYRCDDSAAPRRVSGDAILQAQAFLLVYEAPTS